MKTSAKVVVIGGGVVGVSTLYHLAKKGWTDVVLVERKELTSGSTWHAAGLLPLFNMSYSVGKLHQYSVNFYHELEKETGQPVGFSVVSNIRLACNQERTRLTNCQRTYRDEDSSSLAFQALRSAKSRWSWG